MSQLRHLEEMNKSIAMGGYDSDLNEIEKLATLILKTIQSRNEQLKNKKYSTDAVKYVLKTIFLEDRAVRYIEKKDGIAEDEILEKSLFDSPEEAKEWAYAEFVRSYFEEDVHMSVVEVIKENGEYKETGNILIKKL